ncbi:MAG TPA: hypothetical protein VHL31_09735 [Geminicoccus sp.]|uniref:hypothetical protein n=1 Tax=Geminicoccus sp. TaxID=2024832 RepID=UPI002E2F0547|nr:hypothetical protein [Geminicoccus sp.]HEX2526560.1 hypothetical protein [Geminicoccus sp.]
MFLHRKNTAVYLMAMIAMVASLLPGGPAHADALEARVKLQRNAPRGLEYVPTSSASASAGTARSLRVEPAIKINLDGDPFDNVYSSLLPLDMNGNGTSEYVHWNGHRVMRLYGRAGNKVWQVTNSTGRRQDWTRYMHRDQAVVLDLDSDGKEDILHCWQSGSTKTLVARDGATGEEIRSILLRDQSVSVSAHCRISVYYKQSDRKPIVLLGETQAGGSAACGGRNYTDNWARVAAFDTSLRFLWNINTCDAGHMTAGVDANADGYAEYVFVGKYAIDFNGKIRCTLSGWNGSDHVDAIRLARLDPSKSEFQAVAVGRTGGGAFRPKDCGRLWSVPVKNPQEMVIAQLDPAPAALSITVTNRSGQSAPVVTTVLNGRGQKVRTYNSVIEPMQNAQLDGYRRTDEVIGMFGQVFNGKGDMLLSRNWYWNLKGSRVKERTTDNIYDRWVAYPLLYDMDSDGKEELVTWGQSLIVEGEFR